MVRIAAPIERVFALISDHEGMSRWPGVQSSRLITEGTPRNGLGAVRRIRAAGLSLDEAVVGWEPPRLLEYRIIRGLPVEHLGRVLLRPLDGDVELTWDVRMESRVPLLARVVAFALGRGLVRALEHVRRQCEAPVGAAARDR